MNTNIVLSAEEAMKSEVKPGVIVKRLANCIRWHQEIIEECREKMRSLQKNKMFDPDLGRQVRRSQQTIVDLSNTIFKIKQETGVVPKSLCLR